MKNKIILYLFVFSVLILIFQIANSNKVVGYQAAAIAEKQEEIKTLKAELSQLQSAYDEDVYFSFNRNQDAENYFSEEAVEDILSKVKDKVYESNVSKGDNPLVAYPGFEGKFLINKVKLLNHKWLIADFSDGTYWGELLIRYSLREGEVKLDVIEQLVYPRD